MAKYQFKLLAGGHTVNLGTDIKPALKKYAMGDIVDSDQELDKMFNSPGATKFARMSYEEPDTEETLEKLERELALRKAALKAKAKALPLSTEGVTVTNSDSDLSKKSFDQLKQIAKANGINVSKARDRDECQKIIEDSLIEA